MDTATFDTIRSSILDEDPLPTVNQTYSKVMQEEQVRNLTIEGVEDKKKEGQCLLFVAMAATKRTR